MQPTIVLVHGAFAESASWNGVISALSATGRRAVAAANPLRSLVTDAAAVSDLVRAIGGPVVLVGHSYGGSVITDVLRDEGEACASRLRANGVDVTTVRYDGTIHDFMMLAPLAETRATRAAIGQASAALREALR